MGSLDSQPSGISVDEADTNNGLLYECIEDHVEPPDM